MVVIITVTDAVDSATSVAFSKLLTTSLKYRRVESETLVATQSQAIQDLSTSEANNTEYAKEMTEAAANAEFHIDIRTFSDTESPTVSYDFIVISVEGITDRNLDSAVTETLSSFSDVKLGVMPYEKMYTSAYAKVVLRLPTLSILVNEESVDLYRAAADEIAEFVENYE